MGDVASTAIGFDGSLWALHRGGRVWDFNTFDGNNRITYEEPIDSDVVVQMDPETGVLPASCKGRIFGISLSSCLQVQHTLSWICLE